MKIQHWMKQEKSGLTTTTREIVKYEEKAGHQVEIRQPGEDTLLYGGVTEPDVHCIHSQLGMAAYHDRKPKVMWMHGEPLSSVGNGISMKAICDLAPTMDCFIAMRKEEMPIWSSIKRTFLVPKGIDLEKFTPLETMPTKLEGEPAVLYIENWRGQRNPLYLCRAMEEVYKKLPKARLHLINCRDPKMKETFAALIKQCKWWPFIRTLMGPAATITASDISDIASAVRAAIVSDLSDILSAVIVAQSISASDMSDLRSAITAGGGATITASDMSDIASRVDVLLTSRLSDILSAAQQTNSRALVIASQASDIYSLLSDVSSDLGVMSGIQSDILSAATAIKAKTDPLTFTVANQIDANIQSVNDVTVTGTGAPGSEWGP